MVISGPLNLENVFIDKTTITISARKMHSFFRTRVIPFSDVLRIYATSNTRTVRKSRYLGDLGRVRWREDEEFWETVLELPGHKTVVINGISQQYPERFVIDQSKTKEAMTYLADEINKFMGR